MLIKNCKTVIEGKETIVDILIADGKIKDIGKNLPSQNFTILDAKENYVLPGIIDAHCHMRDPGLTQKEDFSSGSKACARGGVTTFLDMPNTIPNVITSEILKKKKELALGNSYVDYGFHFGGAKTDNGTEIEKVKNQVASTKIFLNMSTGDMLIEDDIVIENIFKKSKIISVHAENKMVEKAIELCEKYDKTLYLCHLSTKKEVELLKAAKIRGAKIFGEVTPHHLFLNIEDFNRCEKNKMLLNMKPDLKTKSDNEALWKGIADGTIDTIGTDHAPHLLEEKLDKITFGIPSVENSLEIMLKGVDDKKITLNRLIEVMCENPAKIFNIKNKGEIKIGYDADFVIIDKNDNSKINESPVVSKCKWTPYGDFTRGGKVLTTIVRGQIVYSDNKFFEKIGREIEYDK